MESRGVDEPQTTVESDATEVAPADAGPESKPAPEANGNSIPGQLEKLADLRDRGAISPDEYQTAKDRLLQTSP